MWILILALNLAVHSKFQPQQSFTRAVRWNDKSSKWRDRRTKSCEKIVSKCLVEFPTIRNLHCSLQFGKMEKFVGKTARVRFIRFVKLSSCCRRNKVLLFLAIKTSCPCISRLLLNIVRRIDGEKNNSWRDHFLKSFFRNIPVQFQSTYFSRRPDGNLWRPTRIYLSRHEWRG